jgi:hypothetical protein
MQQTSGSGSNKISRNATQCNAMQANANKRKQTQNHASKCNSKHTRKPVCRKQKKTNLNTVIFS